jgi:hypothetical protein
MELEIETSKSGDPSYASILPMRPRFGTARVVLGMEQVNEDFEMTTEEARELAAEMIKAADVIEGVSHGADQV